ncbi:MAG TPA: hypothetical protein VFX43_14900, partial [Chitinophagaceae bacterium]|nr:hypothetical protein [Chitinophagaceae bacterium]
KTAILRTKEKPSRVHLSADRKETHPDGEDLSYITIQTTDKMVYTTRKQKKNYFQMSRSATIVNVELPIPGVLNCHSAHWNKCNIK